MSEVASRKTVEQLQALMASLPQTVLKTFHYFADGIYCREIRIPKGVALVGKAHKKEHFCLLIAGEMTIVGENKRERIVAPALFTSHPGAKRAGYAHENSVFITIHRTDSTDLDAIEMETVEPDELALFDARNELKKELIE